MISTVSEFFDKKEGNINGKCIVCGVYTEHGNEVDFSANFTSMNLFEEGNCICEYCYSLARSQDYRRKSWVADKMGVRFLDKKDILKTLLDPPTPPFSIYVTRTGKKQGFLNLINRVNYSKNHYIIAFDNDSLHIDRVVLKNLVSVVRDAREKKFAKSELLGDFKVKNTVHRDICRKITEYKNNPLWRLIVYAIE